ncbi:erg24, C-14 sterol reductase [Coemansia erecta]|nr:erg24, C-14 sterol reductase [Coemansia erecta]
MATPSKPPSTSSGPLNPKTTHREFFGFPGAVAVMTTTVAVLYTWYFSCNERDGCQLPLTFDRWKHIIASATDFHAYFNTQALKYVAMWWAWLAVLYFILPARTVQGVVLRNGQRLKYPISGLTSLLVTALTATAVYAQNGLGPFLWIAEHFFELAFASLVFSTLLAVFVYLFSFRHSSVERENKPVVMLALAGNSSNPVYDFFIGRELNPRLGSLDIKYFCELRPGIMGWVLLNVSFALKQYAQQGCVSAAMWLAIVPQIAYCIDTLLFEDKVLTTMDITTDGFGWMLAFGDLTWVPFMYSLQARYLSFTPVHLSTEYTNEYLPYWPFSASVDTSPQSTSAQTVPKILPTFLPNVFRSLELVGMDLSLLTQDRDFIMHSQVEFDGVGGRLPDFTFQLLPTDGHTLSLLLGL